MATYTVRPAKETLGGYRCLSNNDQVRALTRAPIIYFYPPVNVSLETLVPYYWHLAYFMEPLYQNDTQEANLTEDFLFILEQIRWYARNKFRQLCGTEDFVASLDKSSTLGTISS